MPYANREQLRESLRDKLPKHAQDIYVEAYNNAYERFEDPSKIRGKDSQEEAAHKVAWSAVKKEYHKGDDGKWHRDSD
ncbi:MAG: ChaB family protein [Phycisphaerae bacterium]